MRDRYASLREGLVGAWIPSVSGSGLLLPDLSGNGNNGALTNMGPEDWVSGQYGRALDFDGVDDYGGMSKRLVPVSGNFAVSFWVNERTRSAFAACVSQYGNATGRFLCGSRNGVAEVVIGGGGSAVGDLMPTGIWVHLLGQRLDGVVSLHQNAIYKSGFVYTGNIGDTPQFAIGTGVRQPLSSDQFFFNGQLDDIRIYNRALSEPEIKLLASRPGIGLRPQRRTMYYAPPTGARRRRILTSMP